MPWSWGRPLPLAAEDSRPLAASPTPEQGGSQEAKCEWMMASGATRVSAIHSPRRRGSSGVPIFRQKQASTSSPYEAMKATARPKPVCFTANGQRFRSSVGSPQRFFLAPSVPGGPDFADRDERYGWAGWFQSGAISPETEPCLELLSCSTDP